MFHSGFLQCSTHQPAKVNGADWKPLHHDTAAFSQRRVGKQNITVGVSLGGTGNKFGIEIFHPLRSKEVVSYKANVTLRLQSAESYC